jgi:hypothetical protein
MYNSVATNNSRRKAKNKDEISQLALDSFEAFKPFINVFDCGFKGDNGIFHLITKEDWRLHRRWKAGERGIRYPDGSKFNPYLDVVRNIYDPRLVHRHIDQLAITYYTSGREGHGLLYLDIDAHHEWQTDEYRAKEVLKELFPAYFRASKRGQNGYLKVRSTSVHKFNQVADYLESTLKRLFLSLGILCDIEIKGTATDKNKSGRLAKLPFTTKYPCHMRDETDSWNYRQLELFKSCPILNIRRVEQIVRQLEDNIDEEAVKRGEKLKNSLAAKKKEAEERPLSAQPKTTKPPKQTAPPRSSGDKPPTIGRQGVRLTVSAAQSDDAFIRNQKDIPPFVRAFYRQHRRFPSTEETLHWLRVNGCYSGEWEENEGKRARRVEQVLHFKERTFDPAKLSNGSFPPISLRLGKFSWWVRDRFGSKMMARVADLRRFDPVEMTAPVQEVSIPARFIETFMVVADVCLNQDPLENKAVPTSRFRKLWGMVHGGAPWNQRYFQMVRDRLDRMGVIQIVDRKHSTGKAWRWKAGSFPLGSFKETQRKKKRKGLLGEVALSFEVENTLVENNNVHNTLYHTAGQILGSWARQPVVRPPP